ncbi:hypothetical protein [Streptomyces sp. ODS28]|uniref:hypothetical protein n=1 Tax=Streptomyces sp. ODS28 TaxID=3136688 RepID=UPI0031E6F08D
MSSIYRGEATLISEGVRIPVEAALYTHDRGPESTWSGTLRSVDPETPLWVELEGDTARIRLPDGREGSVLIQGSGFGPVQVAGDGPEPS